MIDFTYYTPTKVFFGHEKHKEIGKIISDYGFKRVMLIYGKTSIKENGVYNEVVSSLKENKIKFCEKGGVMPNPTVGFVNEAVKVAKRNRAQLILAIGGGSVIDASKYTAVCVKNDCNVWDLPTKKYVPNDALPVAAILTISAAGSEMSSSAVITNEETNQKRGCNSDFNRCLFAICNPELTYSVNKYQTACGIVDIMSHTMERYFTVCDETYLTDSIAESILKSVIKAGKKVMEKPEDYEARATIMWASSLSHNDLTGCGREHFLAVHQLEHALSGEFPHIPHGAGLAVLFPAWAKYVYKYNIKRFAQFARNVWDVNEENDEEAAKSGINKMSEFFDFLEMPIKLREFDIEDNCLEKLSELCTFYRQRTIKTYINLDYNMVLEIYKSCY